MIRKNKLFVAVLLFLLLIFIVDAQNGDYDYSSDESYQSEDFYKDSDPNQWDYSKVDWDKIDFSRAELYSSSNLYNNIPDEGYSDLDYNQVDYSLIEDHNKIDTVKYFKDVGCSSCSLDRGNQNLIFSKNGIIHPNGNSVSIPGTYPSGSLFIADEDRIEVIIPKGTSTVDIPSDDDVTLNTQGNDITFPDGTKINGQLSYKDGQPYIKKGDEAIVNDLKISAKMNDVNLYLGEDFDKDAHQNENYVFANSKTIEVHSTKDGVVSTEPQPGNEFFNMFKLKYQKIDGQFVTGEDGKPIYDKIADNKDFLSITSSEGSDVIIHNRADKNLIPKLEHIPNGKTTIKNGRLLFTLDENEFNWIQGATVPMETVLNDPEGKYESVPLVISSSLLEYESRVPSDAPPKLITPEIAISSGNTIGTFFKDDPEVASYEPRTSVGIGGVTVSESIKYNEEAQTIEYLQLKYPKTKFSVPPKGVNSLWIHTETDNKLGDYLPPETVQLVDTWLEKNPEAADSEKGGVEYWRFYGREGAASICINSDGYGACEKDFGFGIGVKTLDPYGRKTRGMEPIKILDHEYGHHIDHRVKQKESLKIEELLKENPSLTREELEREMLQYKYNEIAIKSIKKFFIKGEEDTQDVLLRISEATVKLLEDEYNIDVQKIRKDIEGGGAVDMSKLNKREKIFFNNEVTWRSKEELSKRGDEEAAGFFEETYLKSTRLNRDPQKIFEKADFEEYHYLNFLLTRGEYTNNDLKRLGEELEYLPRKYCVLPPYAMYDYQIYLDSEEKIRNWDNPSKTEYNEVSTTGVDEKEVEELIKLVNSNNRYKRDTTRLLVQMDFDKGGMSPSEYRTIMNVKCEHANCCDKKCLVYTFTCEGSC